MAEVNQNNKTIEINDSDAEEKYITVPEFAKIANVTKQAVYQRLNKDLTEYKKTIDGAIFVSVNALERFNRQAVDSVSQFTEPIYSEYMELLKDENERLKDRVAKQDATIAAMQETIVQKDSLIVKKDEMLTNYTERFASIAEKAVITTGQAQLLHALSSETAAGTDTESQIISDVSMDETEVKTEEQGSVSVSGKRMTLREKIGHWLLRENK